MALKSILTAILMFLLGSEPAAAGWITEAVQQAGDVGSWSSIAVGSADVVHISYYDASNGDLRYAKKTRKKKWKTITIDRRGNVGESSALALTAWGSPGIAFHDITRGTISYAFKSVSPPKWVVTNLRTQVFAGGGYAPSVVFDSVNHFQLIHEEMESLWHVSDSVRGADWDNLLLSSQSQPRSSSLAIDGHDTLHVAYVDICPVPGCSPGWVDMWIVYASNTGPGGAWQFTPIRSTPDGIGRSSIAVDAHGVVHIIYADRHDGVLKYETNATGQFKPRVIYDQSWVYASSMKIDVLGHLHISYTAGEGPHGRTLKYATNKSGAWVNEDVDATSAIGDITSIAIDGIGKPHISYYDATAGDLRHALRQ